MCTRNSTRVDATGLEREAPMVEAVIAISILFSMAVGLTVTLWAWMSRSLARQLEDAGRALKAELLESQSASLRQMLAHEHRLSTGPAPHYPTFSGPRRRAYRGASISPNRGAPIFPGSEM